MGRAAYVLIDECIDPAPGPAGADIEDEDNRSPNVELEVGRSTSAGVRDVGR